MENRCVASDVESRNSINADAATLVAGVEDSSSRNLRSRLFWQPKATQAMETPPAGVLAGKGTPRAETARPLHAASVAVRSILSGIVPRTVEGVVEPLSLL